MPLGRVEEVSASSQVLGALSAGVCLPYSFGLGPANFKVRKVSLVTVPGAPAQHPAHRGGSLDMWLKDTLGFPVKARAAPLSLPPCRSDKERCCPWAGPGPRGIPGAQISSEGKIKGPAPLKRKVWTAEMPESWGEQR